MMGSGTPEDILNRARGNGTGHIEAVRAADVETKPVTWLWNNRIPEGKLTIFDGDPDLGTSVVTLDIAARVSTGRPFADGAPVKEPSNVLICNVEDSADDTIVPRLKAHGADLDRVFLFSSAPDDKGSQPTSTGASGDNGAQVVAGNDESDGPGAAEEPGDADEPGDVDGPGDTED